jgi:hypothetical protein
LKDTVKIAEKEVSYDDFVKIASKAWFIFNSDNPQINLHL